MSHLVHSLRKGIHSPNLKRKSDKWEQLNVVLVQDVLVQEFVLENRKKRRTDNWSQIVPTWGEYNEQDSNDFAFCDDNDAADSKSANILVTIDDVIEFDNSKSPTGPDYEETFDVEQICDISAAFTNSPRLYEENTSQLKGKQMELSDLYDLEESSQGDVTDEWDTSPLKGKQMELSDLYDLEESPQGDVTDEWKNDCQIEEFKFARCFKCRQKVDTIQDCPRHRMKGSMGEKEQHLG